MKSIARSQLRSVARLSEFIEAGRFRYAAQPIHDSRGGGAPRWYEWLVRPDFGDPDLTTEEFVQAVESVELALDMDTRISADALQWLGRQSSNTQLTINVCGASMSNHLFSSHIVHLIESSHVVPDQVCFDLAVHAALGDLSGATRFVKTMRRLGARVALDNGIPGNPVLGLFGPLGFINYLKIDRKWVSAAPTSPSHRETLESIVDYAKRLDLAIIAEGVDSAQQLELINELGIEYYQGYIDGEPMVVAMSDDGKQELRLVG